MKKIVVVIAVLVLGLLSVFTFGIGFTDKPKELEQYQIIKKWEMPEDLKEISGIAWVDEDLIACIQDEEGIIFLYNLATSKIENSVSFAGNGDYEDIAIIGKTAFVLRSDGMIFEISNFTGHTPDIKEHETQLTQLAGINIEGLGADPENNRLLLAVKNRKNYDDGKEIYAFSLDTKNTGDHPLITIKNSDPLFRNIQGKPKNIFSPGAIEIHPTTGQYFILDGTNPKILITGQDGSSKNLIMLQPKDFANPEGLTFSPDGDMYISNEAEDAPANILKVSLNN